MTTKIHQKKFLIELYILKSTLPKSSFDIWSYKVKYPQSIPTRDVGTCFGDSGGPLQCRDGRIWYLWGVTSFGSEFCREKPGVFASLKNSGEDRNEILSWIDEEINGSGPVLPGNSLS